ncbi:MAG: hypothetical protein IJM46_10685 [Oscillospiraceae bacterium]|nr:hypothetical protein [Oscillospiraceae bacterium]
MKHFEMICLLSASLLCMTACGGTTPAASESSAVQTTAAPETSAAPETEAAETEPVSAVPDLDSLPAFTVTSENLHDGVWNTIITKTKNGENRSPQLAWEPVSGAAGYVIMMADTTAGNWLHWKSNGVTETALPEGWASAEEYVGPYPPSGTHSYEVFIFAVREIPAELAGKFDAANPDASPVLESVNRAADGSAGNILALGRLAGTYTHGD